MKKKLRAIVSRIWDRKIIRFLFVGCFNTASDFIFLNILVGLVGLHVLLANSISVIFGITASYFLNHYVVFRHPHKTSPKHYMKFFLITGISVLVIQNTVIFLATHLIVVSKTATITISGHRVPLELLELNASKALAVVVGMFWNFLLYKYIIFKVQGPEAEPENILV